jgi:hypothetical protein
MLLSIESVLILILELKRNGIVAFDLANPEEIPEEILSNLLSHHDVLCATEFLDELLKTQAIREVAEALNKLAEKHGLVGYHYTRSIRASIRDNGLVVKPGDERRREFMEQHGNHFSPQQRHKIETAWANYFVDSQNKARDGLIWFNLTKSALTNKGATASLSNYGGEVIYMPFSRDCEITKVLGSIGEPMVVKCSLDTARLKTFSLMPWGKVWLSSYHRAVNSNAYQTDFDVYTTCSVSPAQIIEIEALRDGEF